MPLLMRATHGHSLPHVLTGRIGKICDADWSGTDPQALIGVTCIGRITGGKIDARNTLVAVPARPGTYPWAAGFRKGAYIHVYANMSSADWHLMPSGFL